jgi:mRNA interferase RelE/StbE
LIWRVEFDPRALDELERLDRQAQRDILRYLRERIAIADDPRRFGKALRRDMAGLWRYRIGDHRIVCEIRDAEVVVLVLRAAHRSRVYES